MDLRTSPEAGASRRSLLIGAGVGTAALLVGGVLAERTLPLRSMWDRWTGACGDPGPIPPQAAWVAETGTFASEAVGSDVGYAIAVPPGYRIGDRLPLAVMLPGRGGTGAGNLTGTHFPDFVAQGIAERDVTPFGLASVDGGTSYWHPRASGEDRMSMLIDEFLPRCADRWRLGVDRRAVVGWSMGGYGAILAAELHPGTFAAVAAASPAIFRTSEEGHGAFDSQEDFARYDVFAHMDGLRGTPVRIDCGTADPFYENDRAFAAALPEPPIANYFKGCHDSGSWRVVARAQVDFLGAALT